MRVLIADDHSLVRSGIRLVLRQMDESIEVLEAADGRAAIELARRSAPDICLLDISMPELNGVDALPLLRRAVPGMKILVLSMHGGRDYVSSALKAGAHGYLLKDAAVDELADALRALHEGRPYLGRQVADALLADFARQTPGAADSPRSADEVPLLTPRQREVLQRIAEGRSTREIAQSLHLSVKTVETHRAELMRRLGIHDVAGLTRYAIRHGLIRAES